MLKGPMRMEKSFKKKERVVAKTTRRKWLRCFEVCCFCVFFSCIFICWLLFICLSFLSFVALFRRGSPFFCFFFRFFVVFCWRRIILVVCVEVCFPCIVSLYVGVTKKVAMMVIKKM